MKRSLLHMEFRSKNSAYNTVRVLFIVAALIALGAAFQTFFKETPAAEVKEVIETITQANETEPITLVFVGDTMLDRGIRTNVVKYLSGDYHHLFSYTHYLQDADVAFANLEGTAGVGTTTRTSKFFFRMDPLGITALRDAGVDVVSFANNHIGDFGQKGFEESLDILKRNNLLAAGAGDNYVDATSPKIIVVKGVRIGYLGATDVGSTWMNATETRAGVLLGTDPHLAEIIHAAKQQVDVLVMSFHFGTEYSPVTARQEKLAHLAIDSGADIVVGHHPHVMQKIETYNGKPIFYSLGNFIFDQYFSSYTMEGMVASVSIDPQTYALTTTAWISALGAHFVPQPLVPFDAARLLAKPFQP